MKKIKISTVSGTLLEKPLITAFMINGNTYVVFDNEMNGTMGLPIILVSKMVNNSLTLVPEEEWNGVKEALRQIISGNQIDYAVVGDELRAEDVFFKQLTLPDTSFNALKNGYNPIDQAGVLGNVVSGGELTPDQVAPATPPVPEVAPSEVAVEQVAPVETVIPESVPVEPVNVVPNTPIMPSTPEVQNVAPVMPEFTVPTNEVVTPNVEPVVPDVEVPVDFTADKEAFLKACENMFDALVAKFNNK